LKISRLEQQMMTSGKNIESSIDKPTVWSNLSTLSPRLLSDSTRCVSEWLEKITFVWHQDVAQQLRYRCAAKNFSGGKKL
jgi:hypothetical protein